MVRLMDGLKVESISGISYSAIDLPKFDHWDIKIVDRHQDPHACEEELDQLEDFFAYKTQIDDVVKLRGKLCVIGSLYNYGNFPDGQNTYTSPITCLKIIGIERFSRDIFDPVTGRNSTTSVHSRVYAAITRRHNFFVIDDYGRNKHAKWTEVHPLTIRA